MGKELMGNFRRNVYSFVRQAAKPSVRMDSELRKVLDLEYADLEKMRENIKLRTKRRRKL